MAYFSSKSLTYYLIVLYYVANMNQSERLHNQGNKEQIITPELELSMKLWDTCVKLLDEKGRNKIRVREIVSRAVFPLYNLFNVLNNLTLPHNNLRIRYVSLKGEKEEGDARIAMYGVNPNKAKEIRVYVRGIIDEDQRDPTFLRLRKGKRAEIKAILDDSLFFSRIPAYKVAVKEGKAKMKDLVAYQSYIQQSSTIERK